MRVSYDSDDLHSAALCAWKEDRGDGETGMRAVLHVIANRVGFPGFGKTVHDVIYGKNQFTSMSVPSDPEFDLRPSSEDDAFSAAISLASNVFDGHDPDLTLGAHYYENEATATSGWFKTHIVDDPVNHKFCGKIGKQVFYV